MKEREEVLEHKYESSNVDIFVQEKETLFEITNGYYHRHPNINFFLAAGRRASSIRFPPACSRDERSGKTTTTRRRRRIRMKRVGQKPLSSITTSVWARQGGLLLLLSRLMNMLTTTTMMDDEMSNYHNQHHEDEECI